MNTFRGETVKRYILFLIGLYANSMGIALITVSALGTTPGSAIPYVLSLYFKPTQGQFSIAFNLLLVLMQIIILGKLFQRIQYLQIAATLLLGYFIDINLLLVSRFEAGILPAELAVLFLGCAAQGLGVYLEVKSNVIMLPGEGFVKAVATKIKKEFGMVKVCNDISLTSAAAVISFLLFHRIRGVGIGTVIAAFIIGLLASYFGILLQPFMLLLLPSENMVLEYDPEASGKKTIITIGREYGCGAGRIGKLVAEKLGIPCYDDLSRLAAEECGLSSEYIQKNEEKSKSSLLYDLYKHVYTYTNGEQAKIDAMIRAEKKVLKRLSEEGSCVIIGRLSNLVLRNHVNAFHVFLYASADYKTKKIMEREKLSMEDARRKIARIELDRSSHYRQYAHKEWARADSYDLTVNTGLYSEEKAAEIIISLMRLSKPDIAS